MQPLPQKPAPRVAPGPAPDRGTILTALLAILSLGAVATITLSLLGYTAIDHLPDADAPTHAVLLEVRQFLLISAALGVMQFLCALGMWGWKRWGAYGFGIMSAVLFLTSAKTDPQHHYSMGPLVWLVIVVVAVLPKWGSFED